MRNKNMWLLLISLGLCSSTILVDQFIVDIPDFLAIIFALLAIITLISFIFTSRKI